MTDEEFPPPWENRPFDWIRLSDEQAHRVSCAFSRRLDLRSLASDALFYSLVLEGRSPHIDETARAAVRHYVDLTRLLLAALPARAEDLNLKLAALTPPDPLVAATRQFARDAGGGRQGRHPASKVAQPAALDSRVGDHVAGHTPFTASWLFHGAPTAQPGASAKPSG